MARAESETTTRRAALRHLAVAAAMVPAVPYTALALTEPVLAPAHLRRDCRASALVEGVGSALQRTRSRLGRRREDVGTPSYPLVRWDNDIGGSELEGRRDHLINFVGIDPQQAEAEYQDAKARERALRKDRAVWDRRAGLSEMRRREREVHNVALDRLSRTKPTTPGGIAALLSYVVADMRTGESDWQRVAIKTTIRTAKYLDGVSVKAA